jgi:hypothetical protein
VPHQNAAEICSSVQRLEALKMAAIRYTTAAVALAVAMTSRASHAQSASMSLTHTVVVTVPPRVKVQVTPTLNQQQQSASRQSGLAVNVNATRAWALVVESKKHATSTAQLVASNGDRTSSMVLYRSQSSQRPSGSGGVSDSEPMILTVVAP